MNRMPVYDLNIIVHLVKFRNFDSKITTVKELIKDLKASTAEEIRNKRYLDRIKQKDIKQELESEEFKFSRQLITSLNVNITNLESFQKNCILVNSWRRTISSGGHWYITINEKFQDGIYLNKFHELVEDKIDMDTPMNSFLLIEYFGDNRASVFREADEQTISSVYSPCYISYEMKLNITHVSNIKSPDEILCYSKLKKTDEFEDESLQMDFYPTREEKFKALVDTGASNSLIHESVAEKLNINITPTTMRLSTATGSSTNAITGTTHLNFNLSPEKRNTNNILYPFYSNN